MGRQISSGIDIVEVERFRKMEGGIRSRFLARVFTEAELDICQDNPQRLAGRFACKEAVSKVLHSGIGDVSWQDIEILSEDNGSPRLILHGKALEVAQSVGLENWSVSISHIRETAAAIAIASD